MGSNLHNFISFATTACNRPGLIRRTYESFTKRLTGIDFDKTTLYINIDPAPHPHNRQYVIDMAKEFFGTVVANMPDEASFPGAVQWTWRQVKTPFIFNLEDDWILLRNVNLTREIGIMRKERNLVQTSLRAYNGMKYEKICLSPSILRTDICAYAAERLDLRYNPEIQMRSVDTLGRKVRKCNIRVIPKGIKAPTIIKDTGRAWAKKQGVSRPPKKSHFTKWIKE